MSDIVQITDYFAESVGPRRMEQYKDAQAPNLNKLLRGLCAMADEAEASTFSIRDNFWLSTAEGVQLDLLGAIFGVERIGLSDADYRQAIQVRGALRSSGTPDDIMNFVKAVYGPTFVQYIPEYPAGVAILTDGGVTTEQIAMLAPAGVGLYGSDYLRDGTGAIIDDGTGEHIRALI